MPVLTDDDLHVNVRRRPESQTDNRSESIFVGVHFASFVLFNLNLNGIVMFRAGAGGTRAGECSDKPMRPVSAKDRSNVRDQENI